MSFLCGIKRLSPQDHIHCALAWNSVRKCEEIQTKFSDMEHNKIGCLFKLLKFTEKLLISQYKKSSLLSSRKHFSSIFFFFFFLCVRLHLLSREHRAIRRCSGISEGAGYLRLRLDRFDAPLECRPVLMDVSRHFGKSFYFISSLNA